MEKTSENKLKDLKRHAGYKFVRLSQTWDLRKTATGVTYGGVYVKIRNDNARNKVRAKRSQTDIHEREGSHEGQHTASSRQGIRNTSAEPDRDASTD